MPYSALSQDQGEYHNLQNLKNYQPPAMFDSSKIKHKKSSVPLPPRRPNTFFASRAFMERIEAQKNTKEDQSLTIIELDQLKTKVVDISEDDILRQIDPNTRPAKPTGEMPPILFRLRQNALLSIIFEPGQIALPMEIKSAIEEHIIGIMVSEAHNRSLVLEAFANVEGDDVRSRRTSLSRAIEVQDFLLQKDIPRDRITIRSMGNQTTIKPIDRVDFLLE